MLANFVAKAVSMVLLLFLAPYMVAALGNADYGLWVLVGSVVAYGSLFDLGMSSAVTKYVAELRARQKVSETRSLIATALWCYCVLGALVIALCVLAAPWFANLFDLPAAQQHTARRLLVLNGIAIGLSIPFATSRAVLEGLHRFDLTSLLATARVVLFAAGTVGVLATGGGIVDVALVQVIALCAVQVPGIYLVYRIAPEYRFGFAGADLASARRLISFSWSLFAINVGGMLQSRTDEIIIGARLPIAAVTPYSLALKLSEVPQMLAEQFIRLVLPIASEISARRDRKALASVFVVGMRVTFAVFFSCGVIIAFFAADILALWLGDGFAVYAPLVWVLVTAIMFDTAQWPCAMVLQGMDRHRVLAVSSLTTGAANVTLSLVLIPHFGLLGVGLGTMFPAAIELLLVIIPLTCAATQQRFSGLFRAVLIPAVLPALPMIALLYLGHSAFAQLGWGELLAVSCAAIVLYAAIYLTIPTNNVERHYFLELLSGIRARLRTGT